MTLVSGGIGVAAVGLLYQTAFREEQQRLIEIAKSHARLIEAIAHFDEAHSTHYLGGARGATLTQLRDAHGAYRGFGKTGEFTLAERQGDTIEYILAFRHGPSGVVQRIAMDSRLAEPMRRALAGQSGTLIGLDYRGARVLAAYEPVAKLEFGIVAKIDLVEIRAPFVRAGVLVGGAALLLIAAGILLFFRLSKPILQRIADSEERFRGISTAAQDAIVMADGTGKVRFWNRAAERLLGYRSDEAAGRLLADLILPERQRRRLAATEGFLRGGQGKVVNRTLELEAKRKDGTEVPVEVSVSGLQLGDQWHAVGIIRDITDRKRAEQEIMQREERLRLILASTGEGIFGLDAKGRCTFANRACIELLGFTREEDLLAKDMHRLVHHTRRDGTPNPTGECPTYRSLVERQITYSEDELLWRCDGTAFHAAYQSSPTLQDGEVVGAVVSFADISARKRAEAAIKQERDFAERLIETAPVIVLVLDPDGRIIRFNSFLERLSGFSRDEVKGKHWRDALLPRGESAGGDRADDPRGGLPPRGRLDAIRTRDGKERLIAWYDTTLYDAQGEPSAILAIGNDVTDEKAKEAQLLQAQKMEMVGQLTGGIAHDFNNLLTVILGNLDLLTKMLGEGCDPEVTDLLMDSLSAAEDGAELTERLLAFSRKAPLQRKRIDLQSFLMRFRRFLNRTLGPDIRIEVDIDEALDTLTSDPPQLESALLNLALNARDAMPDGGRILLEARARRAEDLKANLAPGSYLALAVVDTGAGMGGEQLARAIEPFYTTKASTQGSGLGLTMVFGFCEQAGGVFRLESQQGVGTRAIMILPLDVRIGDEATEVTGPEAKPVTGSGTVLVVDDEERVRKLAGRYLQDLGYQVLAASNGEMAVTILESELDIGLVFSDVVMPGEISGYDLFSWVRERRPKTKVLLATGLRSPEVRALAEEGKSARPMTLTKPYSKEQLAEAIRAVAAV